MASSHRSIGLLVTGHIAAGVVEGHSVAGEIHRIREEESGEPLRTAPAEEIVNLLVEEVGACGNCQALGAIGVAFPGIVRGGVIEESPNLHQLKGLNAEAALREALNSRGIRVRVAVSNDADAIAAGLAASRGAPTRGAARSARRRKARTRG